MGGRSVGCMAVDVGGSGPPTEVSGSVTGAAVETIRAALADIVEATSWQLTDGELAGLIGSVTGVQGGLAELAARLVGSAERRDLARRAGAASTKAWLMGRTSWDTQWHVGPPRRCADPRCRRVGAVGGHPPRLGDRDDHT